MVEPVVGADDQWALTPDDHALVMNKHRANRLGFAILLAFFRDRGDFHRTDPKSSRRDSGAEPAAQRRGSGGR